VKRYFYYVLAVMLLVLCCNAFADPLENANWRIKQYRTREVKLKLRDFQGRKLKDVKVKIQMQRHQFLFGCSIFSFGAFKTEEENQGYLELFSGLFNYATVPFYFRAAERKGGAREAERNEAIIKWCEANHITMKGHTLIWHEPAGNPSWLSDDPSEVERALRKRVETVIREYRYEISIWDLLNEPTVAWGKDTPVAKWENKIGPVKAWERALKWAKGVDRSGVYLVNDFNIDASSALAGFISDPERIWKMAEDPVKHYPVSYKNYIEALKREGAKPDAIGIQAHMHKGNWPLWEVWQLCETYSRLNIPIHFTETTVLSGEPKDKIYWHEPEKNLPWPSTEKGEKEQADYVEKYYKLLFSHPAVEAITWWNLSDYDAWLNAPAGLVRRDLSKKPAYERLERLIKKEWWTSLEEKTDDDGEIEFRGFCGDYQIILPEQGNYSTFSIDCDKKDGQKIEVRVQRKFKQVQE